MENLYMKKFLRQLKIKAIEKIAILTLKKSRVFLCRITRISIKDSWNFYATRIMLGPTYGVLSDLLGRRTHPNDAFCTADSRHALGARTFAHSFKRHIQGFHSLWAAI